MQDFVVEKQNIPLEEKERMLSDLKAKCQKCTKCELGKTRHNVVFSDGKASAKIILIGEAPGADEDATGTPFVGRAGKLLNTLLDQCGISRAEDLYICNTVKCRPPENRVPTREEKELCAQYLQEQIKTLQPQVIIFCGATAAKSFLGEKIKISKIRGQWFSIFGETKAMPIFHPSYLLRNHSEEKDSPRWLTKQDLLTIKQAIS